MDLQTEDSPPHGFSFCSRGIRMLLVLEPTSLAKHAFANTSQSPSSSALTLNPRTPLLVPICWLPVWIGEYYMIWDYCKDPFPQCLQVLSEDGQALCEHRLAQLSEVVTAQQRKRYFVETRVWVIARTPSFAVTQH